MKPMKRATRLSSKGQVVIPKPAIDNLYGCLKNLPRNPLADLEAKHQAEIAAEILALAAASLSDIPAEELRSLARKLQEPES